jgi:hypothetical protein
MTRKQAEALLAYVDAAIERSQTGSGLGAWRRAQDLREAVLALATDPPPETESATGREPAESKGL